MSHSLPTALDKGLWMMGRAQSFLGASWRWVSVLQPGSPVSRLRIRPTFTGRTVATMSPRPQLWPHRPSPALRTQAAPCPPPLQTYSQ